LPPPMAVAEIAAVAIAAAATGPIANTRFLISFSPSAS
jgi:hypothetical protein